jgi:acyl-coenzyme A synthetase/AMP-(fatty) acid ligase
VLGALKAGLVVSPAEPDLSGGELARRVGLTGASLLVAAPEAGPAIAEMQEALQQPVPVVYLDEAASLLRDLPAAAPTHPTIPRDPALVLPTSGTEGPPRLVRQTNAHVWAQRLAAGHWLGVEGDDLVWCTAGTGTATALLHGLLGPWSRGAEVVVHDGGFDADERLNLLEQLRVTVVCQAPEEYRRLAELEGIEGCDLRGLRQAVSLGERSDPKSTSRWLAAFGTVIRDGYYLTETGLVLGDPAGRVGKPGAVGTALPGHAMAVVGGGEELATGDEGELALHGRPPSLFAGYAGESGAPAGLSGDWFLTGDRAVRDDEGVFWLTGRVTDAIATPGATVGALEIEAALLGHPAVADAAAVQAGGGERRGAKAFIVPTRRAEPGDQLAEALREHARHAAGVRAVPVEIDFVEELPRTFAWKLDRAGLRRSQQAEPLPAAPASWPEPARLVVPQPRTLDFEPEPLQPEPEREPEPDEAVAEHVELHAAPDPEPEPESEPEHETEPEPEAAAPEKQPEPPPEPKPEPQPEAAPIIPSAPPADGGLAARLAAYGRPADRDDERSDRD